MKVFIVSVISSAIIITLANIRTSKPVAVSPKKVESNYVAIMRFVKQKEGLRLNAYICPGGKRTIGYGHVVRKGENLARITRKQADSIFLVDFNKAYNQVLTLGVGNLDSARVLASFNINCGIKATRKVVRSGNLANMKKYVYAKGKKLVGLVDRRKQEYAMLRR